MKRSDLEVLLNEKTGSAFHILAKNAKYLCAFRLFLGANDFHMPTLYFRLRMEKAHTYVSNQPSLKLDLAAEFPSAMWTKIATNYGSVLGECVFSCSASDHVALLGLYGDNKVADHIYEYLLAHFGEMQFGFSKEGFVELCDDYMQLLISELKDKVPQLSAGQVIFSTPEGSHLLKDGFEVTPVELDDVVSFSEGTAPVEQPAPVDKGLTGGDEVTSL